MQWRDNTTLPSRGLGLRPVGKSLGLKSGKAQNEHMFSGLPPKRPCSASSDLGVHFILRLKNFSSDRSLTNLRANRECHRTAPRARKPPARPIVCPAAVRYSRARLDAVMGPAPSER